MQARWLGVAFAGGAAMLSAQAPAAPDPGLLDVLDRASAYVTAFQAQLAGIVLEEDYDQDVRSATAFGAVRGRASHRELRSDVLLVKPAGEDRWVQFRDVFEVDRKPVRDRDARLEQLFLKPSASSYQQAERIALESARYNLGSVQRTVNLPVLALLVLDRAQRPRFAYERIRPGNVRAFAAMVASEADVWAVQYRETKPDTLIRTEGGRDLPARGRFWIDAPTGRVLRTELIGEDVSIRGKIDVFYRLEPGLGFLVPAEMREEYVNLSRNTRIICKAVYGKFKKFTVTTEETIKKPAQ